MKKLKEILREFDEKRTEKIEAKQWGESAVAECFKNCAKHILCDGYFIVNGKYIIDLGAIELYYHEEEPDGIKDYIMYHTNAHPSRSRIFKLNNNSFPYFEFGNFNLHQSGVDVTFENEKKKYRASFLIRSYRVLKTEDGLYPKNDDTKYDPHSTRIFDDMFYSGYGNTKIEWVSTDRKGGKVVQYPRKNVAKYIDAGTKVETTESTYNIEMKKAAEDNSYYPNCFKYRSKYYSQCMRNWRFQLENIIEEK